MSSGTWHGAGEEGTVCAECTQTLPSGTCALSKDGMAINKAAEAELFVLWPRAGRWWRLKGDGGVRRIATRYVLNEKRVQKRLDGGQQES